MVARNFRSFLGALVTATVIALGVRLFLVEDFRVTSVSMAPNLFAGDLVFASKFTYNLRVPFSTYEIFKVRRPRRSEVVVFTLPDRGLQTFIKRIVGIEGDRVALLDGHLVINGVAASYEPIAGDLAESYHEKVGDRSYPVLREKKSEKDFGPVEVPKDHFFVLGDNRAESTDSRVWGPVPLSCLKGKIGLVWLSLNENGEVRTDRSGLWIH